MGFALATLVGTAACGTTPVSSPTSSAGTPTTTPSTPAASPTLSAACVGGSPIYMVQPYAPVAQLTAAYKPVIASLSKTLGCPVRFQVAPSIAAEMQAIGSGRVAFAEFAGIGSGFALAGPKPQMDVVATYQSNFPGTPASYNSMLWADHRYADFGFSEVAGHELAFGARGSLSGDYFPRAALIQAGLISKVTIGYAGSHLAALEDLACPLRVDLRVNGCTKYAYSAFSSRVMGPAAEKHIWAPAKFVQIWRSDAIPYTGIGIPTHLTEDVRKELKAALLAIPAGNVRYVAKLIDFKPALTGAGLVAMGRGAYCQESNLDLCDVIKTLKLTPGAVSPLVGEAL